MNGNTWRPHWQYFSYIIFIQVYFICNNIIKNNFLNYMTYRSAWHVYTYTVSLWQDQPIPTKCCCHQTTGNDTSASQIMWTPSQPVVFSCPIVTVVSAKWESNKYHLWCLSDGPKSCLNRDLLFLWQMLRPLGHWICLYSNWIWPIARTNRITLTSGEQIKLITTIDFFKRPKWSLRL